MNVLDYTAEPFPFMCTYHLEKHSSLGQCDTSELQFELENKKFNARPLCQSMQLHRVFDLILHLLCIPLSACRLFCCVQHKMCSHCSHLQAKLYVKR